MAFSINSADLPSVYSHRSARDIYDGITPLRGYASDAPRPLGRRSGNNPKTVRIEADGSVVFQLHQTDCVRYYPVDADGVPRVVLSMYPSVSTVTFINALTPAAVDVSAHCSVLRLITATVEKARLYKLSGSYVMLTMDPVDFYWSIDENSPAVVPWRHYRTDRKIASEGYKEHNLSEFMDFFVSYIELKDLSKNQRHWDRGLDYSTYLALAHAMGIDHSLQGSELLKLLRGPRTGWPEVALRLARHDLSAKVNRARLMGIIKHEVDAIRFDEVAYATDYNHMSRMQKSENLEVASHDFF